MNQDHEDENGIIITWKPDISEGIGCILKAIALAIVFWAFGTWG